MSLFYEFLAHESTFEIVKGIGRSYYFPMHLHRKTCVGMITKGEEVVSIDGKTALLKKNDIYLVPPYTPHSMRAPTGDRVTYVAVCFNDIDTVRKAVNPLRARIQSTAVGPIDSCIEYAVENRDIDITIINDKIRKILTCIDDNSDRPLLIQTIADTVGLSHFYLLHLFKKHLGISLHQYIIQKKIKLSTEYIRKARTTRDIAWHCGFYDQSHFIKHFKRHVGLTPKAFLNTMTPIGF
jgi:AraC-like DNA-binding protein